MKTTKLLLYAGIGALAYYLYKKNYGNIQEEGPNMFKKLKNKVTDSLSKDLEDVASDIPARTPAMNTM